MLLGPSKQLALLTYILASPTKSATRGHLSTLLWGESSPSSAAAALRTSLHRVRQVLGLSGAESTSPDVSIPALIRTDFESFLAARQGGDLEGAIALYGGAFFADYSDAGTVEFEHWADIERRRYQSLFLSAANALERQYLDSGRAREALAVSCLVRTRAPDAELGWRLLLEALIASGEQLAIAAEAEAFAAWLAHQGRSPDSASLRLLAAARGHRSAGDSPIENPCHALVTELVGREKEFSEILKVWSAVGGGRPHHIHISAPAGLGKTRLLDEVARRIQLLGGCVVRTKGNCGEREVAYSLAASIARELAVQPGATGIPPATVPVLIGLQPAVSSRFPNASPLWAGQDLLLQRAQALSELLSAVAEERPTALLIDDLHWGDSQSHVILRSLANHKPGEHVLIVTAGRGSHDQVTSAPSTMTLPPLAVTDIETLLTSVGTFSDLTCLSRLASALHRSSFGSPLYVLDLLRLSSESGYLTLENGQWTTSDLEALLRCIETAKALENRLNALDNKARNILEVLAVAGTPWGVDDIAVVTQIPDEGASTRLLELERRGYVSPVGQNWEISSEEVARVLLEHVTDEELRAIHHRIGTCLAGKPVASRVILIQSAKHLVIAKADSDLTSLARKWVRLTSAEGDKRPTAQLVQTLLGDGFEVEARRLARRLPLSLRYRPRTGVIAATLVCATVLASFLLATQPRSRAEKPEAEFLVATGPDVGTQALLRFPVSRGRWTTSDSIAVRQGKLWRQWHDMKGSLAGIAVSPDGHRIAFAKTVPDSGVTDLFVQEENGAVRRLTASTGDDVEPVWSPDGRFLAFQTLRWSPQEDQDFDLAILDLSTGSVRPLTAGPDGDRQPRWSPDGSRIAFVRQRERDGRKTLCWTSFDGVSSECLDSLNLKVAGTIGWLGSDRVVATVNDEEEASYSIAIVNLSTLKVEEVSLPYHGAVAMSPDGIWVAVAQLEDSVLEVFRLDEPLRRRRVRWLGEAFAWLSPQPAPGAARLNITPTRAGVVGVAHLLTIQTSGVDSMIRFPPATLRWESGDTSIVTISRAGEALPRKQGKAWIHASAGGWSLDSIRFLVRSPTAVPVFIEEWRDSEMKKWSVFGDPKPMVVSDSQAHSAFFINGDKTFESGAVTRDAFAIDNGLGAELTVRAPIIRPKWQRINIALDQLQSLGSDGANLGPCALRTPPEEGRDALGKVALFAGPASVLRADNLHLTDGGWHRVRIQIFPDASCGYAIDGIPLLRSRPAEARRAGVRLAFSGQSVGTRILIGPVVVWEGVKTDIDWSKAPRRLASYR